VRCCTAVDPDEKPVPELPRFRRPQESFRRNPVAWLGAALRLSQRGSYFLPCRHWLLDRTVISKLGKLVSGLLYGNELDHRDRMYTEPFALDAPGRAPTEPFWFDYVSDIGDGQLANYNLACLLLTDLALLETEPQSGPRELVALGDPKHPHTLVPSEARLPRGTFMMIGGDTAYQVADTDTLRIRTRGPFEWARQRLQGEHLGPENPDAPPWVFAVPGNHDLYDSLIGFNKVFIKPHHETANPNIRFADFNRVQTASYFCVDLPHGFRFIGMHSQGGHVDYRQQTLVKQWAHVPKDPRDPNGPTDPRKRLIVATSQPSTVFRSTEPDSIEPFEVLGVPRPFLDQGPLAEDAIQLDLSGDVHHYARYTRGKPGEPIPFQSVVAGGGAFTHPGQVIKERNPKTVAHWPDDPVIRYPQPEECAQNVTARLFNPVRVMTDGFAWAIGGVLALLGRAALKNDCECHRGWAAIAVLVVLALGVTGYFAGAGQQKLGRRLTIALLAMLLGALVLFVPSVAVESLRCATLSAACAGNVALAFGLGRVARRAPKVAAWLGYFLLVVVPLALACVALDRSQIGTTNGWLVAVIGAVLTCTGFGAYLALSLALNCHMNEAGIVARLDQYCHFLRIKVEPDRIRVYVIGVRELAGPNDRLAPVLIDDFYVGAPP